MTHIFSLCLFCLLCCYTDQLPDDLDKHGTWSSNLKQSCSIQKVVYTVLPIWDQTLYYRRINNSFHYSTCHIGMLSIF